MTWIDNITLALTSLKAELEGYVKTQGWDKMVTFYLSVDPELKTKEIVLKNATRSQINLPLVVIDTGLTRTNLFQLGDEYGEDVITVSLHVMCFDGVQLLSLGNLLRRKLNGFTFSVLNYTSNRKEVIGTAVLLDDSELVDISTPNSDKVYERNSAIINVTLELNSQSFL